MSILGWALMGIAFAVVEIVTVTFFPVFFAASAVIALFLALAGAPEWSQWLAFGLGGFALSGALRPIAKRQFERGPSLKSSVEALPGRIANVSREIAAPTAGAALIDGQTWTANAEDPHMVIPAGVEVTILEVRGAIVVVRPTSERAPWGLS